jgi:ABC-type transport system substrate-binding protein
MTFPKFSQWKQLFKVLNKTEKKFFIIFFTLLILSVGYFIVNFYLSHTEIIATYGGTYVEGVVGQPRFINPIYGETNDTDRTLIGLIYSGLMTYDKNGKLINDLLKDYQISENGKIYTFTLKENIFWQDGTTLTADDVIYTIQTIQNSDYKSPLRALWLNVGIQKLSDKSFSFTLGSPYNSFLENCTIKIIPQHIWSNISAENFALSHYNLKPIGSGQYLLSNIKENSDGFIESLVLSSNNRYYSKIPYISKITFKYFQTEADLINSANKKTIEGFSVSGLNDSPATLKKQVKQGWTTNEKFQINSFSLPRYFAVFFNTNNKILSDPKITQALTLSTNKEELRKNISEQFKEKISPVNSPILSEYFGYTQPTITYDFDKSAAEKLIDKTGFKLQEGSTVRSKPNVKKAAFQFKSYLSIGSKGSEVTELQGCLTRLSNEFGDLMKSETIGKFGQGTSDAVTAFQKKYMPSIASTGEVGSGTRTQLNKLCFPQQNNSILLQFNLTTINQPELVATATLLASYWQEIGVQAQIKTVELSELKTIIKNRNYDALLYGQALGSLPDLYPFWHSTQINDPGLNLSSYQNKNVDKYLKDAREALTDEIKTQNYIKLQNAILTDAPALFLYNPDYSYWVSKKIKGIDTVKIIDPSKRFSNITNWYVNTKRIWK